MQPGHFFTEYLTELNSGLLRDYSRVDTERAKGLVKRIRQQGILFSVEGDPYSDEHWEKLRGREMYLKPPYPVCVLEYLLPDPKQGGMRPRMIFVSDEGDGVLLVPVENYSDIRPDVGWIPPVGGLHVSYDVKKGELPTITLHTSLPDTFAEAVEAFKQRNTDLGRDFMDFIIGVWASDLNTYITFCKTLHDYEVTFADIEPDEGRNKMRRARGKAPLFSYKVLTIGKPKRKSQHLGGTHASPRSHLRRGHYRTSSKGVRYWVQPCMVKGETDGFVHKDYVVEGAIECEF